jgi:uncharacterized phage protein (TIGR01671 family)
MRELFFRAWDNKNKKMIKECFIWGDKQDNGLYKRVFNNDFYNAWMFGGKDCEGIILEQFTGMIDRNGKQVFEGDIVTSDLFSLSPDMPAYVTYYDERAVFIFKRPNPPMTGCWGYLKELVDPDDGFWIEVIGNIHQNPELLKGGYNEKEIMVKEKNNG